MTNPKRKNFYVLELTACRLSCGDTGCWTHASSNLDALKKFVKAISFSLESPILKLKINLFQTVPANKDPTFYQWSASCTINLIDNSDDYKHNNSHFLLKQINEDLEIVDFENDNMDKEIREKIKDRLENSFKELWAHFDKNLKGIYG